jgi:hypothetical protein
MTLHEQYKKQLEMFEQLESFVRATQYPSPDDAEAWREDAPEPAVEDTMIRLQVIANGFLTLISRQLFWLQGHYPEAEQTTQDKPQ